MRTPRRSSSRRGRSAPRGRALALAAILFFGAGDVRAELDLGELSRALGVVSAVEPGALRDPQSVVVELPLGTPEPDGYVPIAGRLGVVDLDAAGLSRLSTERPELRLEWTPPRRLLLDRADGFIRASGFRNETGLSGRGVVIGLIDTGVDPRHPDLRDANGRSRILWWLDFSRSPLGRHPELEAELGCSAGTSGPGRCAVMNGDDVNELLANDDDTDDPRDIIGHGTHVASLAAGRGAFDSPYVGVAPEASLIVVRATRASGGIFDGDVLKAARFVFERAGELGAPAVLNLSLGSDFGGHDGSSGLERGLEALVGAGVAGRAIVVAAGNSASLYDGLDGAPGPFGVHTEVHVPRDTRTIVPVATLATSGNRVEGEAYFWIATRPGDALKVGVSDTAGDVVSPLPIGYAASERSGDVTVTVANELRSSELAVPAGTEGAIVIVEGSWPSTRTFGLVLEGPGSARIWAFGSGGLSPERGPGPLLPRASKQGTVNVPASSPGLIAVGATLNRTDWIDESGESVSFPEHGELDEALPDGTAYFSSAGPNALGQLKPELVAPGANLIGAMAATADPSFGDTLGMFASGGRCEEAGYSPLCFVVDPRHAVASGTSLAAPLVSGAIALLFEANPELDQTEVRALLQAGARPPDGAVFDERQTGAGVLDLERTFEALRPDGDTRLPGSRSRLILAAAFVHPDPSWPLDGAVALRDEADRPASGFLRSRLALAVSGAEIVRPLTERAPGFWDFALAAPAGSGGRALSIEIRFDGRPLVARTLPIAVDPALAAELPIARGGCAFGRARGRGAWSVILMLALWRAGVRARRSAGALDEPVRGQS